MRFRVAHVGEFNAAAGYFDPIFGRRSSQLHTRRDNPSNAKAPRFVLASRASLA
jgi:hypothetical protein